MRPENYDALMASDAWQADLRALNVALTDSLVAAGEEPLIGGSPFYRHMQHQTIVDGKVTTRNDQKRRRLFEVARRGRTLFEIGVNGGHGILLQKAANPDLTCIGLDICQTVGAGHPRADIYCPVAMRWLESRFPGDMRFLVGSSHDLLPGYVAENPNLRVDILRLDGARKFFYSDFKMLRPLLHAESYIIFDEPGWPQCRETVQRLMDEGALRPDPEFSPLDRLFDQDPVMRLA